MSAEEKASWDEFRKTATWLKAVCADLRRRIDAEPDGRRRRPMKERLRTCERVLARFQEFLGDEG